MKVKDLIQKLQDLDPDMPVMAEAGPDGDISERCVTLEVVYAVPTDRADRLDWAYDAFEGSKPVLMI